VVAAGFSLRKKTYEYKNKRKAAQIAKGILHRRDIHFLNYVYKR
jgi:hypothetical protein